MDQGDAGVLVVARDVLDSHSPYNLVLGNAKSVLPDPIAPELLRDALEERI